MSGGKFDYKNTSLAWEVFGDLGFDVDYGDNGFIKGKTAARLNPLEDREMSELVWDVFVVLYSYDYYASGDIPEERYREDVRRFKDKWFGKTAEDRLRALRDDMVEEFRDNINIILGIPETLHNKGDT